MANKKITVNLPEEEIDFIKKIAEKEDLSFTDVLRRSINSEKFFVEQEQEGSKLLVEQKDKQLRQVSRK